MRKSTDSVADEINRLAGLLEASKLFHDEHPAPSHKSARQFVFNMVSDTIGDNWLSRDLLTEKQGQRFNEVCHHIQETYGLGE